MTRRLDKFKLIAIFVTLFSVVSAVVVFTPQKDILEVPKLYDICPLTISMDDIKEKTNNCLSHILAYLPENFSGEISLNVNNEELCYDFENDPLNISGRVDVLFEEHPDDWGKFINFTTNYTFDPIFQIIYEEGRTEVEIVKVFNGTRMGGFNWNEQY